MFRENLKISIRSFIRNKIYSIINILGLSIGLACVLIILSWVRYEMSFDDYHKYSNRIIRVQRLPFSTLAPSFVPLLKKDFPEIEEIARLLEGGEVLVKFNQRSFIENRVFFAEENIFEILSFEFISGNARTALANPNSAVITESIARKYFGSEDPLGKNLLMYDTVLFNITGVIRDLPMNTHWHADFLVSYLTLKTFNAEYFFGSQNFSDNICLVYARIANGTDIITINDNLPAFIDRYVSPFRDDKGINRLASEMNQMKMIRLTDIHLHSHTNNEIETNGDIKYVRIFSLIALFILVIACINFVNLSVAKSLKRAKEVAIKKVFGANKLLIIKELFIDSLFYTAISLFLAIVIYETVIPYFSGFWQGWTGKGFFSDPLNIILTLATLVFTALAAGFYPALHISGFEPIYCLKGNQHLMRHPSGTDKSVLRKSLVIVQFAISISVMIGIGIINKQLRFIQNSDLGYDRENIIMFSNDETLVAKWDEFKQRLMEIPGVEMVTASKRAPTGRLLDAPGFEIEINDKVIKNTFFMPHNRVEYGFFKTYGIEILAGRDFDLNIPTDATGSVIINESAVKALGLKDNSDVLGSSVNVYMGDNKTVIGVCRDFNYESLHFKIPAMITYISRSQSNTAAVRLSPGNSDEKINAVARVWDQFHNDVPFVYTFLDERIKKQYQNEARMLKLFNWFGLLAIIIACMGLYGLTAYSAESRTKEIGIRRANGAKVIDIILIFSLKYTRLVLIAFIAVIPLSYYFMSKWLQNFAYKTSPGWQVFVLSGIIAMIISLITVSWLSYRAANKNVVEALRYE
jgi:putative ABC transport system permease protein